MLCSKSTIMKYNARILLSAFFIYTIELIILLKYFRVIRGLFAVPEIGREKIIGYAQYVGYPMYFDIFLFYILLFSPVAIIWILYFIRKFHISAR